MEIKLYSFGTNAHILNPIVCLYAHARQRIVSCNKQTISYCTVSYYIQSYIISDHVVSHVFD